MQYNLEGKIFRSMTNTDNGEVTNDTLFSYHQDGKIIWAEYEGGEIIKGHLIGNILDSQQLDICYHHVNKFNKIMIGKCLSTPEFLDNGKLKFKEKWQWLSGDCSRGSSEIIEQ